MTLSAADKLFLVVGLIDFGGLIACIGFTVSGLYKNEGLARLFSK